MNEVDRLFEVFFDGVVVRVMEEEDLGGREEYLLLGFELEGLHFGADCEDSAYLVLREEKRVEGSLDPAEEESAIAFVPGKDEIHDSAGERRPRR